MPYALCPMLSALCPMLYALCSMPYALCPMPYALYPMPYALRPLLLISQRFDGIQPRSLKRRIQPGSQPYQRTSDDSGADPAPG